MTKSKKRGLGVKVLFDTTTSPALEQPQTAQLPESQAQSLPLALDLQTPADNQAKAEPADEPLVSMEIIQATELGVQPASVVAEQQTPAGTQPEAAPVTNPPAHKQQRQKTRNTFVIYEDTMKTLDMLMLLAEGKKVNGKVYKVTYGDLIDEAVQTLLEKKAQDGDFQKKLENALKLKFG